VLGSCTYHGRRGNGTEGLWWDDLHSMLSNWRNRTLTGPSPYRYGAPTANWATGAKAVAVSALYVYFESPSPSGPANSWRMAGFPSSGDPSREAFPGGPPLIQSPHGWHAAAIITHAQVTNTTA
jgi:hypothetical protein